jgi:hypothetical protein
MLICVATVMGYGCRLYHIHFFFPEKFMKILRTQYLGYIRDGGFQKTKKKEENKAETSACVRRAFCWFFLPFFLG